jgi:hypothetical protein
MARLCDFSMLTRKARNAILKPWMLVSVIVQEYKKMHRPEIFVFGGDYPCCSRSWHFRDL